MVSSSQQAIDLAARVLLDPGDRVWIEEPGYLVVPEALVAPFVAAKDFLDRHTPSFPQAVVAEFMEAGHFGSHLRTMRYLYQRRQRALRGVLGARLGERLRPRPDDAGMHLVVELPDVETENRVMERCRADGLDPSPLSRYYLGEPRGGLLLGYACVPEAARVSSIRCRFWTSRCRRRMVAPPWPLIVGRGGGAEKIHSRERGGGQWPWLVVLGMPRVAARSSPTKPGSKVQKLAVQNARVPSPSGSQGELHALQRAAGNQAVGKLVRVAELRDELEDLLRTRREILEDLRTADAGDREAYSEALAGIEAQITELSQAIESSGGGPSGAAGPRVISGVGFGAATLITTGRGSGGRGAVVYDDPAFRGTPAHERQRAAQGGDLLASRHARTPQETVRRQQREHARGQQIIDSLETIINQGRDRAFSAPLEAVAYAVEGAAAFFGGFVDQVRAAQLTEEQEDRLLRNAALSSPLTPVLLAGMTAGVAKEVAETLQGLLEIDEALDAMTDLAVLILAPGGDLVARELGQQAGQGVQREVEALAAMGPYDFAFHVGMKVGPILVGVLLALVSGGGAGALRLVGMLRKVPGGPKLLGRLERLGAHRVAGGAGAPPRRPGRVDVANPPPRRPGTATAEGVGAEFRHQRFPEADVPVPERHRTGGPRVEPEASPVPTKVEQLAPGVHRRRPGRPRKDRPEAAKRPAPSDSDLDREVKKLGFSEPEDLPSNASRVDVEEAADATLQRPVDAHYLMGTERHHPVFKMLLRAFKKAGVPNIVTKKGQLRPQKLVDLPTYTHQQALHQFFDDLSEARGQAAKAAGKPAGVSGGLARGEGASTRLSQLMVAEAKRRKVPVTRIASEILDSLEVFYSVTLRGSDKLPEMRSSMAKHRKRLGL